VKERELADKYGLKLNPNFQQGGSERRFLPYKGRKVLAKQDYLDPTKAKAIRDQYPNLKSRFGHPQDIKSNILRTVRNIPLGLQSIQPILQRLRI